MRRILVSIVIVFSAVAAMAAMPTTSTQDVLAKILIEFPRYMRIANSPASAPVLCIADDNEFLSLLHALNTRQKTYAAIHVMDARPSDCSVIYAGQKQVARKLLTQETGKEIAIISNYSTFVDEGGAIGLVEANGSIRIELNLTVAQEKNLHFSPDLIELSGRVIQ